MSQQVSNPSVRLYTQGGGTASSSQFPSSPVIQSRNPGVSDITGSFGQYPLGQEWINTATGGIFCLTSFAPSAGMMSATWTQLNGLSSTTGKFTPGVAFAGSSTGITYTTQSGNYVLTGNTMFINAYIVMTAVGSATGIAELTGLPMVSATDGQNSMLTCLLSNITPPSNFTGTLVEISQLSSVGFFLGVLSTGGYSLLTNSNFTATTTIYASGFYFV